MADLRAVLVPRDTPEGVYVLRLGLYDPDSGRRLLVADGPDRGADHATIGRVTVVGEE